MSATKPVYRPVKDDGATFKCVDCDQQKRASEVWHYLLPNGNGGIACKECIDPEWLERAVFDPKPI